MRAPPSRSTDEPPPAIGADAALPDVLLALASCERRTASTGEGFNDIAVQALKANADERANGLPSTIAALKAEGIVSANGTASALTARGYVTPWGGQWTARSVLNVAARLS